MQPKDYQYGFVNTDSRAVVMSSARVNVIAIKNPDNTSPIEAIRMTYSSYPGDRAILIVPRDLVICKKILRINGIITSGLSGFPETPGYLGAMAFCTDIIPATTKPEIFMKKFDAGLTALSEILSKNNIRIGYHVTGTLRKIINGETVDLESLDKNLMRIEKYFTATSEQKNWANDFNR